MALRRFTHEQCMIENSTAIREQLTIEHSLNTLLVGTWASLLLSLKEKD